MPRNTTTYRPDAAGHQPRVGRFLFLDQTSMVVSSYDNRGRLIEETRTEGTTDLYEAWGKPEKAAEWRAKLIAPATQPAATTEPDAP